MKTIRHYFSRLLSQERYGNTSSPNRSPNFQRKDDQSSDLSSISSEGAIRPKEVDIKEMAILNCKDLTSAIEFFDSSNVQDELKVTDTVLYIQFQIEDEFGELTTTDLLKLSSKCSGKSVVIFIESKYGERRLIYWKSKNIQHFLIFADKSETSSYSDKKIHVFVADFLAESLSRGELGLQKNHFIHLEANKIELHFMADYRDFNLLLLAAETGKADIVQYLLEAGISPESQDETVKAQDLAWKNKHYDVIVQLLRSNIQFPIGLDIPSCSDELKNFIKTNNQLHDAIISKDPDQVKHILDKNQGQAYFYNLFNESAAKIAICNKAFEIYELLISHKIFFAPHEDEEEFWEELEESERKMVREIHFKNLRDLPEKNINILMANSFVGHDVHDTKDKREHVLNAYKFLNTNPLLTTIIMVVVASKKLRSVFDFNRDSVNFADPTVSSNTSGMFYPTGRIYIGAKQLLNAATKYETYAVLAHELCHCAVNLTYRNFARPYLKNDNQTMQEFERISEKCQKKHGIEPIIDMVYEYYPPEMQHAELIVRVPHLLTLYHDQQDKLMEIRKEFFQLFDFYEQKVIPEMMKSLPEIENRDENEIEKKNQKIFKLRRILCLCGLFSVIAIISAVIIGQRLAQKPIYDFKELNYDEKMKVMNSLVYYKNIDVKLDDLFSNNNKSYEMISSEHLSQIFDEQPLNFSDTHLEYLNKLVKYTWADLNRKLKSKVFQSNLTFQNESIKFQKIQDISPKILDCLTFDNISNILDGNTVTIGNMIANTSIFFIERKFMFENTQSCFNESLYTNTMETFDEVIERNNKVRFFILSSEAGAGKTVSFEQLTMVINKKYPHRWVSYIDLKEFTDLYNETGLFENVELLMNQIMKLDQKLVLEKRMFEESFRNGNVVILWNGFDEISPTYSDFILNITGYIYNHTNNIQYICTRPLYSNKLQEKFMLKSYQLVPFDKHEQELFLRKYFGTKNLNETDVDVYVKKIQKISENFDFNTPLMLQLIAEIYDQKDADGNKTNLYGIYNTFVDKKIKIFLGKNSKLREDVILTLFSNNFNSMDIYTKFSIKNELDYINIQRLKVMQAEIPKQIKYDHISSMGILYINDEDEFAFAHKTFAEFFVARYFIENIYKCEDKELAKNEAERRLETLFYAFKNYENIPVIFDFMDHYIDSQDEKVTKSFHPVIRDLLTTKYKRFFFEFLDTKTPDVFNHLFKFFKKDQKVIQTLLQVNQSETLCTATFNPIYRPHNVNYTKFVDLAKGALKEKDLMKFMNGRNQKGKILFGITNYRLINITKSHEEYNIGFDEVTDTFAFGFLERNKDVLTESEQKELFIYLTNPRVYVFFNITDAYYETFWSKYEHLVTEEETKQIIGDNLYSFVRFHYLAKYSGFKNLLNSLLTQCEKFMTDMEIYDMIRTQNIIHRATLKQTLFVPLWKFLSNHSNDEQRRHILLRNDTTGTYYFYNPRGFLNYLYDSTPFIVLHYSLIYANADKSFFSSVRDIYEKTFNKTQMRSIITDSVDFMPYLMKYGNLFISKQFIQYLGMLFKGEERMLDSFLKNTIRPTNLDIFQYSKKVINPELLVEFDKLRVQIEKSEVV